MTWAAEQSDSAINLQGSMDAEKFSSQELSDDVVDQRGSSVNHQSQSAATSSMIIEGLHVVSRPDSGSEDKIVAEDIGSRLEQGVDRSVEY